MSIEVKLTFKSLDEAIHALSGIPRNTVVSQGVSAEEKVEAAAAATPAPRAKKAAPAPAPTPAPAPEPEPVATPAPVEAKAAPALEYDRDLKPLATKLIGINPEAFKKICADLGVTTFKLLPADRWADALEATKAALEELAEAV